MYFRTGPLGCLHDFGRSAVQNFVIVAFHSNSNSFVREARHEQPLAFCLPESRTANQEFVKLSPFRVTSRDLHET
jgi:hypothetical protein